MSSIGRRIVEVWCGCLAVFALCSPAFAIPPHLETWQLYHTSWTAREGAPTGIQTITQTSDGYLWLGTPMGLFRFDGVRFTRYEGDGASSLLSSNIFSLFATTSGDLWIGYLFGGVSVIRDGRLIHYTERDGLPTASVRAIAQDSAGAMWVATSRGLRRFDGQRWIDVAQSWNGPRSEATSLAVDGAGTMWAIADEAAFYLRRGARRLERVTIASVSMDRAEIGIAPDGAAWLFDSVAGAYRLGSPTDSQHLRQQEPDQTNAMLIDREGGVWRRSAKGLRRFDLQAARKAGVIPADRSDLREIMTSDFVMTSFEDREGNVWFGTAGGLDKFREPRLQKIDFATDGGDPALSSGEQNTMWVGSGSGQLFAFDSGGQLRSQTTLKGNISALYRDPSDALWIAGPAGVWRRGPASNPTLTGPFGDPQLLKDQVQSMAMDVDGHLWVSVVRAGLFRVDARDRWTLWGGRSDLPQEPATILATDDKGALWLGYTRNRVVRLDSNAAVTYSQQAGLDLGAVMALSGRRGSVWVGGERGLARFDGHAFRAVLGHALDQALDPATGAASDARGRRFTNVLGIVETATGDLWLSTGEGVVHISAAEVRQVIAVPDRPVQYQLLNYLDGMPGTPQIRPVPSIVESNDGQLWFSTPNGVVRIDPQRIRRNTLKPSVLVASVTADGARHEASGEVSLPARTRNLQIDYTALSLSIPERVQFRYRLEGVDASWQDVGTRRVAYYTDLEPGDYRFQVVASNNDNVWNEEGATLRLVIPPTFFQTRWFLALCVLGIAMVVWLLVRMRLRQIIATNRWRLEERLVERERIARELHDTLLQGVQGLILKFQSATERIPADEPARALMEQALDRADQVLAEGRDRVTHLRTATQAQIDLVQALQRLGAEMMQESAASFRLTIEGTPRPLHPVVLEEATRIGSEAITNAFNHARAHHIGLHVTYGSRRLTLRIRDDGQGFNPALVQQSENAGHWGITGMRERADRIRARLQISSRPGDGTTVELRVPAPIAYGTSATRKGRRSSPAYWDAPPDAGR